MANPRTLRNIRLENEYKELMAINGEIIQIEAMDKPPHENYRVTFNIRTIVGPEPIFSHQTVCLLKLPPNYPKGSPTICAESPPYPFHVNWRANGSLCQDKWNLEDTLVDLVLLCARTLQSDPAVTNVAIVMTQEAMGFWRKNKGKKGIIPSDTQVLPTLDCPEPITVNTRKSKKIKIKTI
ncbi:MAG: hypothetical protein LBF58_10680 [Deltaproteobacteria bacterium]|jgi:ubiquitin-protein ligase|nr:hypothetical protein [Deltaproteobacteria bacterium]